MTVWTFGSINVDHVYSVRHLPAPGETIAAQGYSVGLGGKGANQSVAAARAGAKVHHIGSVGYGADWVLERLADYGVDTTHIAVTTQPTGHAIINVAEDGENAIVILTGANGAQSEERISAALSGARAGDILLLQNETTLQLEAAHLASVKGMRVLYSAAPFDAGRAAAILPYTNTLLLNEVEAAQLERATGVRLSEQPVANIVMTMGPKGARWIVPETGAAKDVAGLRVAPVDTTGAGDTFAGYLAAGLERAMAMDEAMRWAGAAAALKVTRKGAADAIPSATEVAEFLAARA